MGVSVHREADLRMTEGFLDHLWVYVQRKHQGSCRVSKGVEADSWQSRSLEKRPEVPSQEVRLPQRPPLCVREHKALRMRHCSQEDSVSPKGLDDKAG